MPHGAIRRFGPHERAHRHGVGQTIQPVAGLPLALCPFAPTPAALSHPGYRHSTDAPRWVIPANAPACVGYVAGVRASCSS